MSIAADLRHFIISNFLLGRDQILNDDGSFLEQGIIDSTGILELVTHLEDTYGIEISEEELIPENLDSINRIAGYLDRKLNHSASADTLVASVVYSV